MGPSNSGKSTLALALGRSQGLPVVHLDRYRHIEASHWNLRSDDDFTNLHDMAVRADQWIIEGNYSALLDQRLARATGFILLDSSSGASVLRYIKRTLGPASRAGGLEGVRDRISWSMIRYILGPARENRRRYRAIYEQLSLPKLFIANRRALRHFYRDEALEKV
jgi:adenylate kinase family enzyme